MVEISTYQSVPRYGAIGFLAATLNVFIATLAAWVSFPYFLLYVYFIPLIVVDFVVAIVLVNRSGVVAQAGRGMLIGLLSVPLAPAVIWLVYVVASA